MMNEPYCKENSDYAHDLGYGTELWSELEVTGHNIDNLTVSI